MSNIHWALLLAMTLDLANASEWTVSMVANYFDDVEIHYVDAIVCSDEDANKFLKLMSTSSTTRNQLTFCRIVKSLDIIVSPTSRTGIFIDLTCEKNQQLLRNADNELLFSIEVAWLIWDPEGILRSFEWKLPIFTFSNVVSADISGLERIQKIWREFPVERIPVGHWDNETEKYVLRPTALKIDLKGSTVNGAMTFIHDIYRRDIITTQLQDDQYRPGIDIVNRLYYANLLLIGHLYNFKLRLKYAESWGDRAANGTWMGMVGLLVRNETDVSVSPMVPVPCRMDVATPTFSLVPYWIAVVFKQPRALGTYKAMLLELSVATWVSVLGMIAIGAITFSFTQMYGPNSDPNSDSDGSFGMGIVQSVGIMANQGLSLMPQGTSSRIVCFSLLAVGLLVSTYYSAATMTALLSPSPQVIKSVDDLIASNIPLIFRNASYVLHLPVRRRIFSEKMQSMIAKPDAKFFNLHDGTQAILNGSAFIDEYSVLFQNINTKFKSDVVCDLTVFNAGYFFTLLTFVRQNRHLREMIVRAQVRLFEHGHVHKTRGKWIADRLCCSREIQFIHVHMEAVSVAFVILLIGFILSVVFYFIEIIKARRDKLKQLKLLNNTSDIRKFLH